MTESHMPSHGSYPEAPISPILPRIDGFQKSPHDFAVTLVWRRPRDFPIIRRFRAREAVQRGGLQSRETKCPDDGQNAQQTQDDPNGRFALPGIRVERDVAAASRTLFGLGVHVGAAIRAWQRIDRVAVEFVSFVRVFVFAEFVVRPFDWSQGKCNRAGVRWCAIAGRDARACQQRNTL